MATMDKFEEREIRDYATSQLSPEKSDEVILVQKVGRKRITGEIYESYDVHLSSEERFWVITNPTNLYDQTDFKSLDQALTYHIGLRSVLHEQFKIQPDEDQVEYVSRPWRRFARAQEAMNEAVEAEDYQAVGLRCRDALITLVKDNANAEWVRQPEDKPQAANVKEWMRIYSDSLTTDRPRAYIRALAEKTWDLTNWLQHYSGATEWDAQMVLDATAHLLNTFTLLRIRHSEVESLSQCPACDSRQLREDGSGLIERNGHFGSEEWEVCLSCGWQSDHTYEEWSRDRLERFIGYVNGTLNPAKRTMDELDAPPDEKSRDQHQ
ncbi:MULTISPECIES: hypothetical protein [Nocardia]|uniref:hypothetical protein n=1 Tax=Nocardia TaxID=1817 RepID=UPI000A6E4EFE|nr:MULTISPECIES: hypothetical protein [Nocardia]MBF6278544.1 hypothetical protein [Nocardia nova]